MGEGPIFLYFTLRVGKVILVVSLTLISFVEVGLTVRSEIGIADVFISLELDLGLLATALYIVLGTLEHVLPLHYFDKK